MLYGDNNRCMLLSDSCIVISRSSSVIRYSTQYSKKDILPVSLSLPRCFNGRIYDYSENKIVSFPNSDFKDPVTREFHVGSAKDYYKLGKDFYFIKSGRDSHLTLLSKEPSSASPKALLVFRSPYCFDGEFIFVVEDGALVRVHLRTLDRKVVRKLATDPLMICCKFLGEDGVTDDEDKAHKRSMSDYSGDIVAYTDSRNKLHIHRGKDYRLYHWLSNRADHLSVYDDYIIAASKSGDVVKFHSRIQRTEPLFKFGGDFVDMKTRHNKLHLLSVFQFSVFDLESQSLVHRETLVIPADYKVCNVPAEPAEEDSRDIFNLKKQSKVEVFNSLDSYNHYSGSASKKVNTTGGSVSRPFIVYAYHRHIYIFDPAEKILVSQFLLDSDLNFVSNNRVLAFMRRRTSMVVRIFSIFQDRLVLSSTRMVLSKDRAKITNAYYVQDKIFIEVSNNLCYVNKLNLIEILNRSSFPLSIRQERDELFIIDDRGVLNVLKREYTFKQKRSINFCIFKGLVVFFIENKGLYVDLPERRQVLEIKNIIDIRSEVEDGREVLRVIHLVDGRCLIEDYDFDYGSEDTHLEKRSEKVVENSCFRILCDNICATKSNQLIIA